MALHRRLNSTENGNFKRVGVLTSAKFRKHADFSSQHQRDPALSNHNLAQQQQQSFMTQYHAKTQQHLFKARQGFV